MDNSPQVSEQNSIERLEKLALNNCKPPIEEGINFPNDNPPNGCLAYDIYSIDKDDEVNLGAISSSQQDRLNLFKKDQRKDNEEYLRNHPEIEALISLFLSATLKERPSDIYLFASKYFSYQNLAEKIKDELEVIHDTKKINNIVHIL